MGDGTGRNYAERIESGGVTLGRGPLLSRVFAASVTGRQAASHAASGALAAPMDAKRPMRGASARKRVP